MQKYTGGGDKLWSLNEDDPSLCGINDLTYDSVEQIGDGVKKDLFEILIKGAAFKLATDDKITEQERDILLFAMGIDEYYPRKEAKEQAKFYKISNLKVRTIRYQVAQKVLKEIQGE